MSSVAVISAEIGNVNVVEEIRLFPAEARVERKRQWLLATFRGGSPFAFWPKVREAGSMKWTDAFCGIVFQRMKFFGLPINTSKI